MSPDNGGVRFPEDNTNRNQAYSKVAQLGLRATVVKFEDKCKTSTADWVVKVFDRLNWLRKLQ
jgi:hypothetical protein